MGVQQTLTLTCVGQDKEKNTSQVRILWQSAQTGESYNETARTAYYYIALNGGAEEETAISYTLPYQSTKTLLDKTVTVQHDSSGNGHIAVRTWMDTNISAGVVTLSKTLQLAQIPRESTLTASDGLIGGTSRIAVGKNSKSFTHSIAYQFGSLTGFVTANGGTSSTEVKFSAESVDLTIPDSFYNQIPNSPSGICTLTLKTYSGDTLIGEEQTATFTASANEADCCPTISAAVSDVSEDTDRLTGDRSVLVRYHSGAACVFTATARKGATIVEKRINGTAVTGTELTLSNVETGSFSFYAKDSRGFTCTYPVSCELIPYIRLTNNSVASRNDPTSGNATLTVQGSFFNGSFGAENNALTVMYQVNGGSAVPVTPTLSGNTYSASVALVGLNYENSYTVTVTAADKLETAVKTITVGKGLPVFDWGEKDFAFHVPVSMDTPLSMANGGTGRKDWGGTDQNNAVIIKSPDGAYLGAVSAENGALFATATNGAPKFGTLPVAQGGTGATTAAAARAKLGAAPAGFLSESLSVSALEDLDGKMTEIYAAMANRTVRFVTVIVNGTVYCLRLWRATDLYGNAELSGYHADRGIRRRVLSNGTWTAWDYDEPPMYLGEEYRTTGRWQGQPVYTKLIDFGALPNSSTKSVAHGISVARVLRAEGQVSNGQAFPICGSAFYNIALRAGTTHIDISTDYNYSAYTATVQLWYTKA